MGNKVTINKDVVIIGAGPAGLSAALYACLDKIDYLLIDWKKACWFPQRSVDSHYIIDNYLGLGKISGTMLQQKFIDHYKKIGGSVSNCEVLCLTMKNNVFKIETTKNIIFAKSVIIATGAKTRKIRIKGYENVIKFIHDYCTISGKQYIGKRVAVLGGRNSGAVAACYLHDLGCKVTLIEIKNKLAAKDEYQRRIAQRNIKVLVGATIIKLAKNAGGVEAATVYNGEEHLIKFGAIFNYTGRVPNLEFCKIKIKTDKAGYVKVDEKNETTVKRLFAAGDITTRLKQIITASGDGANAYYYARKYLDLL